MCHLGNWALWAPSAADPGVGKLIQVEGNVHSGFTLDVQRGYNLATITSTHSVIPLGQLPDDAIVDAVSAEQKTSATPIDPLEQVAFSIPAPGPSLNSATSNAVSFLSSLTTCVPN